jgi:hypothetical protein
MANVHSENTSISVALLSATEAKAAENSFMASGQLFGVPLVAQQIEKLRARGVSHFLIEIETVSGVLVALADKLQKKNVLIDFVRSPQELVDRMDGQNLLFVQSEGVMADASLLTEMLAAHKPMLATLDGRDENERFERIDLNTRWTGLAIIDRQTITAIAALPSDYSIASSLLRQALQDKIATRPLKQEVIQGGALHKIRNDADYTDYSNMLLTRRVVETPGTLESRLGGPIAKWLAPRIWGSRSGQKILDGLTLGTALASFASGYAGFGVAATVFALFAIFGITISNILQVTDNDDIKMAAVAPATWVVLFGALGMMLWQERETSFNNLFPLLMLSGTLLLALLLKPPAWQRLFLPSPALAAVILLVFATFDAITIGAKLLAVVLVLLLIAGQIKPDNSR